MDNIHESHFSCFEQQTAHECSLWENRNLGNEVHSDHSSLRACWPWNSRLEPKQTATTPLSWGGRPSNPGQLKQAAVYGMGQGRSLRILIAAVTNQYKFSGLKQYTFIFFWIWWSEIYNRGVGRAACPLEASWANSFLCLSQLVETICILWLVVPYSIFKASSMMSSLFPDLQPPSYKGAHHDNPG